MRRRGGGRALTAWEKFEMVMGRNARNSYFESEEGMGEAWRLHRDEVLDFGGRIPGRRPWAWWHFDHPQEHAEWDGDVIELDGHGCFRGEALKLVEMGEASPEEERELRAGWDAEDAHEAARAEGLQHWPATS